MRNEISIETGPEMMRFVRTNLNEVCTHEQEITRRLCYERDETSSIRARVNVDDYLSENDKFSNCVPSIPTKLENAMCRRQLQEVSVSFFLEE